MTLREKKSQVRHYTSKSKLQVLYEIIGGLIDEGYELGDISVLFSKTDRIPDRSFGYPYCSATGNSSDKVVVSTVRKYSGLERPVVVVVDLECSLPEGCIMRPFPVLCPHPGNGQIDYCSMRQV